MNVALFGSGKAKRAYRTLEARVLADGGIIQSPEATLKYYAFLYRTFGYVPRRTYSALAGVKLNTVAVTNLLLWSEQFDNEYWEKTRATISINAAISPENTLTADYIVQAESTNAGVVSRTISVSGSNTFSIYVKKVDTDWCFIHTNTSPNRRTWFNILNGTIGTTNASHTNVAITRVFNTDWFRLSLTDTSTTSNRFNFYQASSDNSDSSVPIGTKTAIWGFQLQTGAKATDYIKSEATAGVGTASYVSKMYDMNPISPIDAIQTIEASRPLWDTSPDCSHRIARFDGNDDWLNIPDLGIFNNQGAGTYFAIYKDTNLAGGSTAHYLLAATGNTSSFSRASLATKNSSNVSQIVSRRSDGGSTTVTQAPTNYSGFRSNVGIFNWSANQLNLIVDKSSVVSSTLLDGAGLTSATNSASFDIGSLNNGSTNTLFPGVIAELHADRSIYTQAQINALHEFMKQFYPTLS